MDFTVYSSSIVDWGQKPDILSFDLIGDSIVPAICPKCNHDSYIVEAPEGAFRKINVLKGPYYRYERRESDLYFDLKKKYLLCTNCGQEISIVDFQVMTELISSKLPPEYARMFSMKNMRLYDLYPEKMKALLLIFMDDFMMENTEFFKNQPK